MSINLNNNMKGRSGPRVSDVFAPNGELERWQPGWSEHLDGIRQYLLHNQSSHFSLTQISSISTTNANQPSSHFNHSSQIFQPLSQIFQPHSNILDILSNILNILSNILNILSNILNILSNILHLTFNMMGIVWCGLRPMLQFHFVPDLTNK